MFYRDKRPGFTYVSSDVLIGKYDMILGTCLNQELTLDEFLVALWVWEIEIIEACMVHSVSYQCKYF
jgi:hypothetical protein